MFAHIKFVADDPADDANGRGGVRVISALFFIWFFAACIWTVNALRRPVPPDRRFPPLWLPGMLISELAPIYFVARALIAASFLALGAADRVVGVAGFWLFVLSELGLVVIMIRTVRGARDTGSAPSITSLFQVWDRLPDGVQTRVEVPYWEGLTLDIYTRSGLSHAPALVYIHPGSWMRGRPGRQARALFHRLAERGWVILDIRYPLSPDATFPDHLIGVKRALAWAKDAGRRLGIDPEKLAVSGGSSGAHLAALAALTSGRPELQPGFEDADVSVAACVPFYGIYDLLIRNPTRYDWPFIARTVMKARPGEAPELYELGSPVDQVHGGAPPFLVIHGELDSVVLPDESRHFVAALRSASVEVDHLEVKGAQHGFDAIASLRTRAVANLCADWLSARVPNHVDLG
ncbi:MAG TPA: alpha/beta hydrolase [Acidimicrobiia bacterium]|nr:alpha/beta hydrolase [Acidimicrobiia bacterium]